MALEVIYNHSVTSKSILYTNCLIPPSKVLNGLILTSMECFVRPYLRPLFGWSQIRSSITIYSIQHAFDYCPNKQKVPMFSHQDLIEMCLSFKEEQAHKTFIIEYHILVHFLTTPHNLHIMNLKYYP